jgi:hypothetical protein
MTDPPAKVRALFGTASLERSLVPTIQMGKLTFLPALAVRARGKCVDGSVS